MRSKCLPSSLGEEAPFADDYQPKYGIAQACEADLSCCLEVERIERLPLALPSGQHVAAAPDLRPIPAFGGLGRTLAFAGEAAVALVLIVGGCGFTGIASLL